LKVFSNSLTATELKEISENYVKQKGKEFASVEFSIVSVGVEGFKENLVQLLSSITTQIVFAVKMNDNLKVGASILVPPDPKLEASVFNKGIHNWNSIVGLSKNKTHVALLNPQWIIFTRVIYLPVDVLVNAILDTASSTSSTNVEVLKIFKR